MFLFRQIAFPKCEVYAHVAFGRDMKMTDGLFTRCAMFEAIHGSAPRRAGQNLANPSGLLLGAVMMLVHIDQEDVAERVHNAWLKTIEDGVHTYDIFKEGLSREKVATKEFARAVVSRVGQRPEKLKAARYAGAPKQTMEAAVVSSRPAPRKETVGVDVFLDWKGGSPADLGKILTPLGGDDLKLGKISNRGIEVWRGDLPRPSAATTGAVASWPTTAEGSLTLRSCRCSAASAARASTSSRPRTSARSTARRPIPGRTERRSRLRGT